MKRSASAAWTGGLKNGKGSVSTASGVLDQAQYGFRTRFEDGVGTNPEELIAAAHAGCFTMALAAQLEAAGMTAERLETTASVTLEQIDGSFSITAIHLDLLADIPGANLETVDMVAGRAKSECPVSRLLNAEITLATKLKARRT
ncbi:MAG TPA: OsmC family protein [Azospira sp.]|nr:OsmC family protein [Azospira sp.]